MQWVQQKTLLAVSASSLGFAPAWRLVSALEALDDTRINVITFHAGLQQRDTDFLRQHLESRGYIYHTLEHGGGGGGRAAGCYFMHTRAHFSWEA